MTLDVGEHRWLALADEAAELNGEAPLQAGPVFADGRDGLGDSGPVVVVKSPERVVVAGDQTAQSCDLLLRWQSIAPRPLCELGDSGVEPFTIREQAGQVGAPLGLERRVGAEVLTAQAAVAERAGAAVDAHVGGLGAHTEGHGDVADAVSGRLAR